MMGVDPNQPFNDSPCGDCCAIVIGAVSPAWLKADTRAVKEADHEIRHHLARAFRSLF